MQPLLQLPEKLTWKQHPNVTFSVLSWSYPFFLFVVLSHASYKLNFPMLEVYPNLTDTDPIHLCSSVQLDFICGIS